MKLLVTGAGALLGQGMLRSVAASSLDAHVIAVDPSPLSAGLYWADEKYLVPMASSPEYGEVMEALIDQHRPDAVLVGTDVELHHFAAQREHLEATYKTHVVVSSPDVVAIADDKYATARFMSEHGFAAPDSCLASELEGFLKTAEFPLVVKPRVGARSVGVSVVEDREALDRDVQALEAAGDGTAVIQECLQGDEYTAGALVFDGQVDATIVMRRDLRDGNTYRAYVEAFPELNAQVAAMAMAFAPHGPVNFQFRLKDGQACVFEINGRFSGTTPFRMHAGLNEVERTIRRLVLGEMLPPPDIKEVVVLRHWTETVLQTSEVLK